MNGSGALRCVRSFSTCGLHLSEKLVVVAMHAGMDPKQWPAVALMVDLEMKRWISVRGQDGVVRPQRIEAEERKGSVLSPYLSIIEQEKGEFPYIHWIHTFYHHSVTRQITRDLTKRGVLAGVVGVEQEAYTSIASRIKEVASGSRVDPETEVFLILCKRAGLLEYTASREDWLRYQSKIQAIANKSLPLGAEAAIASARRESWLSRSLTIAMLLRVHEPD